ncbi:exopolyphosphatase [Chelatococcus sp. SYSU_G07232]|uniref:exopolyphosphatase n=1 Tax=Chelatococcus albus TaxID=3047466 RepID=A0ABT7ADK6_9HYPH|nr:exopolyphosphatase [Chelatococcus sp. SYSU_G07232]MDJ1157150.1 exopolyphosphatase [Chelatococcus sp. SYSU_G07232]
MIDIGSNSVRLVAYEGLTRAPTPIFNEKVLCGLGRNVATTGRLAEDAVNKALKALARFRVLCDTMQVERLQVLATAAARDASNGPEFLERAAAVTGRSIELLSGRREAELSAYGIISGFHEPDGVVGDLGGGSLELVELNGQMVSQGVTLPLGGLALQDLAGGSVKKAQKLVREAMAAVPQLDALKGRTFYAVGGTWRALANLHMRQKGYPLHVMHGYRVPPRDVLEFARIVERVEAETLEAIDTVSEARRPLLAYGALVLDQIIRRGKPKTVVVSAFGVREGLLYEQLDEEARRQDPLLVAASDLNILRSRSPRHGEELIAWTDRLMETAGLDESVEERRLRHAACLLADIGWRAHPDYRGEQSLNIIAHAAFVGVDHPGRAYLALSVYFRHVGLSVDDVSPRLRELVSPRMLDRARILGGAMRVAYLVSAAMPGVLPRVPIEGTGGKLMLTLPRELAPLANERLQNRVKQLARLIGLRPDIAQA